MRILLDTNIFIPLEDSTEVLKASFSDFIRLAHTHSHTILIHKSSFEDIDRDKDQKRRSSMFSRFKKYEILEDTDEFSEEILSQYNLKGPKDNDTVDNIILAATYHNAVHLLVTEDRGIHKKASKLGISDNVLYLQQAVDVLKRLHPQETQIFHPNLANKPLHQINLQDPFFDSLRNDYDGFDEWFRKSAAEGRSAWINMEEDTHTINAILIYKSEHSETITTDHKTLPNNSLKISTFKVAEKIRGRKIGELLFKTVFEYAYKNGYSWVYLTVHPDKHAFLKDMCIDLGFYEYGIDYKSQRDQVLVKQIGIQDKTATVEQPFEFYRKYSPALLCEKSKKYIIPIQKQYHQVLFPDNQKTANLFLDNNPPGNTLKKAYLSHAPLKTMAKGDIILFYRTGDEKRITTLAVVEDYFISQDSNYIASKVAKRTVYSFDNIAKMTTKPTKVLIFRQVTHFTNRGITSEWMYSQKIVHGNIQSITQISDKSFYQIMEKENAKNCTPIN